jgi:cytochrome c oxidase subunit 4
LSEHAHAAHSEHSHGSPNDWKMYLGILVALLFLTVVTVGAASFDFGSLNVVIAVLIATTKASLVALYFMHLRHDKGLNSIIFLSALLFLAFLLILCLIDVNSRIEPKPYNWKGPEPGLISPSELSKPKTPNGAAPADGAAPAQQGAPAQQAAPGQGAPAPASH